MKTLLMIIFLLVTGTIKIPEKHPITFVVHPIEDKRPTLEQKLQLEVNRLNNQISKIKQKLDTIE
jgi:hypothetical protein